MSSLKKRALMFSKSLPDYVKDGLVLWLDGEEALMSYTDDEGTIIKIWRDRAVSGQKANVGGVTQTADSLVFDGVNSRAKIENTQPLHLSGVLRELKERTLEIVCKINNTDSVQVLILGYGSTESPEKGAAGLWYRPASSGFKVGTWLDSPPVLVSNVTERASYSIVYGDTDLNDFVFYQNGVECSKGEVSGSMYTTMTTIGARLSQSATWQFRLNGEICCIRVYNRKLTDAERAQNLKEDIRRFDLSVG